MVSLSGTAEYLSENNTVIWNGAIPQESSIIITYQVTINSSVTNGTVISNQGTVYFDTDEDGINDATELTDDTSDDDGLDQDGDGDTDDDDPTDILVVDFVAPSQVEEDFSQLEKQLKSSTDMPSNTYFGRMLTKLSKLKYKLPSTRGSDLAAYRSSRCVSALKKRIG